jgi:phenylpyruvate tautomerase
LPFLQNIPIPIIKIRNFEKYKLEAPGFVRRSFSEGGHDAYTYCSVMIIFIIKIIMPYLKIQTNKEITDKSLLMKEMTDLLMNLLGKPEKYIMIAVEPLTTMLFGGSDEPAAFIELKSIGLPSDATAELSEAICNLLNQHLDIPPDRIYIEFSDAPRNMFGWNGGTFG